MSNLSFMIVDDDEATRTLVKRVAQSIDCKEVQTAADGKEAWEIIRHKQPDILILDWEMPEMDGLGVLTEIHKHKMHKDITIMMLTANKERAAIEEAINLGACDYIVKPLKIPLLKERLEKLITLHTHRTIANLMDNF